MAPEDPDLRDKGTLMSEPLPHSEFCAFKIPRLPQPPTNTHKPPPPLNSVHPVMIIAVDWSPAAPQ